MNNLLRVGEVSRFRLHRNSDHVHLPKILHLVFKIYICSAHLSRIACIMVRFESASLHFSPVYSFNEFSCQINIGYVNHPQLIFLDT